MNRRDLISMGVRNLLKRKLRTFLTVLGVTIGTASIVVMVSLGLAVNASFAQQIENMGDMTLIEINNYNSSYMMSDAMGNVSYGQTKAIQLNDETIASFEDLPGVIVATPVLRGQLYFKSGTYYMYAYNCMGVKPDAMELLGYNIGEGRLLQEGDGKTEVVFGYLAEKNFQDLNSNRYSYDDRFYPAMQGEETETYVNIWRDKIRMSPDSRYIQTEEDPSLELDPDDVNAPKPIKPYEMNVVGLLEDDPNDWNKQQGLFFTIDALKELAEETKKADQDAQQGGYYSARKGGSDTGYETAYVKCEDLDSTIAVNDTLTEMGFQTYAPVTYISSMQEMTQTLQILLAAIGGVSLFVAAIGIANTMVMSIYERTREIGVMKVIGAAIRDIKWLFLLESAMIGFFGGALGLGLSFLLSYIMNNTDISNVFGGMVYMPPSEEGGVGISLITPWLCAVAMGFSSVVGLLSGYFPARRAMKLSALSAIRTE